MQAFADQEKVINTGTRGPRRKRWAKLSKMIARLKIKPSEQATRGVFGHKREVLPRAHGEKQEFHSVQNGTCG